VQAKYESVRRDVELMLGPDSGVEALYVEAVGTTTEKVPTANLLDTNLPQSQQHAVLIRNVEEIMAQLNRLKKERTETLATLKQKVLAISTLANHRFNRTISNMCWS
jgi:hypothetical protein